MRISGNSRAFTMVELMAAICIVFVLVFALVTYVPQVIDWARQTSDRQTLTVLNDALSRYKTEGGSVGGLSPMTPISQVLTSLQTGVTWGGIGHQFLHGGVTYTGRSLSATGMGAQYRFTRYNYYTAEPGISDLGPTGGSLVGWWKFDEGSGAVASDSSKGNSGSLQGTPPPTWAAGHNGGNALRFPGIPSSYVTVNGSAYANTGDVTVAMWIYPTFINSGDLNPLLREGISSDDVYSLSINTDGKIRLQYYNGAVYSSLYSSSTVSLNTWSYVTVVRKNNIITFYINGIAAGSATGTTPQPSSPPTVLALGGIGYNQYYTGLIDDVRIYNRALTAAEVTALYGQ